MIKSTTVFSWNSRAIPLASMGELTHITRGLDKVRDMQGVYKIIFPYPKTFEMDVID
ncbi:hypothetical protein [Moorena producens]|uniref:hypothetical protein n=1 Tax=Moorena producens TaxID=1155739 RepID=UPI00131473A5|nr:hypothetical protein [Moorena producens]